MLKKPISILFLFICFSIFEAYGQIQKEHHHRIRQGFNDNWKFKLSDSISYKNADFDDSNWKTLNLPHDWSIQHDFSASNSGRNAWLPGGIGWYRKTVVIPEEQSKKEFKIEFDGVYKNATLWVNGHYVGNQHDGYTSFYYNITPFIKFGKENTYALKVDNSIQPNCRWYTGSGIYSNVWLTNTNTLTINQWGTSITTPKVSENQATISIETSLRNFDEAIDFILETTIFNSFGEEVKAIKTNDIISRKTSKTIHQDISIEKPLFWSIETPKLYTVISKIIVGDRTVDMYKSKFGIRTIDFDAKKGFFLNGKNLKLKGVCLHNDGGILGTAVPIEIWERRLTKLKDIGCNAIRTAHHPFSPEFLDLCDTMGFLVIDEFVDKWAADKTHVKRKNAPNNFFNPNGFEDPYFEFEWQKNYQNTIERDRNHPSIIMWSVGNENHPPESEEQVQGLRTYAPFMRSLDPTRPVISGMERGLDGNVDDKVDAIIKTCQEMDLIALNYGEQWCKQIGNKNPGMPYVSTESYRYFSSSPEKRFADIERSPWFDVMDNDYNMGLFLWVGIDYLGESKKFPQLGIDAGLLDMAGFRKAESYLYEALWSEKPMVRIAVYEGDANDFSTYGRWWWPPIHEHWNHNDRKKVDVVTYTNCESVNLYLNNRLIGNKKLSDFENWIMKWQDIPFKKGTLKAVGLINGKEVCDFELKTTGKPSKIDFKSFKDDFKAEDVVQVEVSILDKNGLLVSHLPTDLSFELKGDAKILGLSSGDINDTTPARNITSRTTKNGKCLVILKLGKMKASVQLLVSSEGLKKGIFKFE